jgi:hypothetical protein
MDITRNKQEIAAEAMREARAWLDERKIRYQYLPPHQLKIGAINFWPGRGTITIDGEEQRRPDKGLVGLEKVLIDKGIMTESDRRSPKGSLRLI